jgi:hypothetical protein
VVRDCGCDAKPFMYCVVGAERCDDVLERACGCAANPFTYGVAGAERCDCAVERDGGVPGRARVSARSVLDAFSATSFDASCVLPRMGFCVDGRAVDRLS